MRAATPSERKDPRDANPMFKRLPAEVISRRKKPEQSAREEGEEAVSLDRKSVFLLKPEQRLKWLSKALKQVGEGKVRPSDLYDVVASTRFAENLPPKVGRKMGRALKDQVAIFTGKQQKFLIEQAEIITRFLGQEDLNAKPAEEKSSSLDEMMARVSAFVSQKESERGKGGDSNAEVPGAETAPAAAATTPEEAEDQQATGDTNNSKPDKKTDKDKKEKKEKGSKGKAESKSAKDDKATVKSGKKDSKKKTSSSESTRSRSKSRDKKKRKTDKSSKKASSKKRTRSSESSASSSSSRRSSSHSEPRKKNEEKKRAGKKRRRSKSSSSSSSSSSKRRGRKRKKSKR